jgi:hypothetical protein
MNDGSKSYAWGYLHAFGPFDPNAPSISDINGSASGHKKIKYSYTFKSKASKSPTGIFYSFY